MARLEDDETLDDQVGRQAAARLRDQLELDLGEPLPPPGKVDRDGLHLFSIEQRNLRDAALVTALNLSVEKSDAVVANVEVLHRGIRLTRQKRSITCRAICPIVQNAPFTDDGSIEFGLSHRKLEHIGRGPTGNLQCTLDLNKALLSIDQGAEPSLGLPLNKSYLPPRQNGNYEAQPVTVELILTNSGKPSRMYAWRRRTRVCNQNWPLSKCHKGKRARPMTLSLQFSRQRPCTE